MSKLGRLAREALVAADAGQVDNALRLAEQVIDEVNGSRLPWRRRTVVYAALAAGVAVNSVSEYSISNAQRALDVLDIAFVELPKIDQDIAIPLAPMLLSYRIAINAGISRHATIASDLTTLEESWDRLVGNRTLMRAMNMISGSLTIAAGALINASTSLVASLRLHEALRPLGMSRRIATYMSDAKLLYVTAVDFATIARLLGDQAMVQKIVADVDVQQLQAHSADVGLPDRSRAYYMAMLAISRSWIDQQDGNDDAAINALRSARRKMLGTIETNRAAAYLEILGRELNLLLELDRREEARALATREQAAEIFAQPGGGVVLVGPLVRMALADDGPAASAALVRSSFERYGWNIQPTLLFQYLGEMARSCAWIGDDELTLECVRFAITCIGLTTSGGWASRDRAAAQDTACTVRDGCLLALSGIDDHRAPSVAVELAEAWREQSIRLLLTSDTGTLPLAAREIISQITGVLGALQSTPDLSADTENAAAERLADLRASLEKAVGAGYASMAVPQSFEKQPLTVPTGETWVTASVIRIGTTRPRIVCTVLGPETQPTLRVTELSQDILDFVEVLDAGFDPIVRSGTDLFEEQWNTFRPLFATALCLDLIGTKAPGRTMPIRAVLDNDLRQLPVCALGVSENGSLEPILVVHGPFLPSDHGPVTRRSSSRPRVLTVKFSEASNEVDFLRQLEALGRIELTAVECLSDLKLALNRADFDVLVISSHGDGHGLAYFFEDDAHPGDVLYVHDILGVQVPPVVLAAACNSGQGGASDITGLVATLLTHGAREVLTGIWSIPTQASGEIIEDILDHLDRSGSIAEKLHTAQMSYIERHPDQAGLYWWAGLRVWSAINAQACDRIRE